MESNIRDAMNEIDSFRVSNIRNCAAAISQSEIQYSKSVITALHCTGRLVESHLGELLHTLAQELRDKLLLHDKWGIPPSFIHVAGQGDLEKPFNRLLAWWSDVHAGHGLGRRFLKLLAIRASLLEMYEDIDTCEPEILAEQVIGGKSDGRMPDLMVRTKNAALMVENKVYASESGDQYAPYLGYLEKWAEGRAYRAILSARDTREIPTGWDGFILHRELAELFDELWNDDTAPVWGRISAKLTANAFNNESDVQNHIREARVLLSEIDSGSTTITAGLLSRLTEAIYFIPQPIQMEVL